MSNIQRRPLVRILAEVYDKPWAITQRALDGILEILAHEQDLDALAARLGRPLENAGNTVDVRDGVAVLNVEGPIVRYASIFDDISGATSVQVMARDFQAALDAPNVRQILLNINSPGGQVDGIQEFADMIRAGTQVKPVTAYIDGLGASAAYWIAAAASRIAASESSLIGSVGVVAAVTDNREAQQRQGVRKHIIVSSNAPNKRPDPATDEGQAQIQETVDSLEGIFISRLAQFRATTVENVQQNYGRGKTLIARRAVAAGMADEITSFEPLVARLAADKAPRAIPFAAHQEVLLMPEPNTPSPAPQPPAQPPTPQPAAAIPVPAPEPQAPARSAGDERQRIAAIFALPEAQGRETLARALALESDLDAAAAQKILASAAVATAAAPAAPVNALAAEMAKLKNPAVGKGDADVDTAQSEALRVLAFIPQSRRVKAS